MCAKQANHLEPGPQPTGATADGPSAQAPDGHASTASNRWRTCLDGADLLTANTLGILVPFLVFRYVMLKAFQTFNLRVSSGELWANLPALVRQDVIVALGVGLVLAVVDLAARNRRRWLSVPLRVVSYIALPLVAVLVAGLYAVYLNLGFFPSLASIETYLSPGSPLLQTADTYVTAENAALLAVLILFPLVVKWLCLRYRKPGRGLGLALLIVLAAGWVWPVPDTLTGAAVHPFGQVYDGLVHTTPDWDLDRWSEHATSYRSISGTASQVSLNVLSGTFADHDVVMVISESTGRCYLCGEHEGWTYPNLRRLAAAGMDFTRYYTAGDSSIPSLFGLFTSRPPLPLRSSRWYYPTDRRVLLPLELKRRGYRTGFFHAGSFSAWFDHELFASMRWDVFEDAGSICYRYGVEPESSSRLGKIVDERLVARRVLEWAEENRGKDQRFFAVYFTSIPHLPYDFRSRTDLARHTGPKLTRLQSYENELAYVDGVLGEMYDRLQHTGFFENGLLIYTGDHGEAFGQHPGVVSHSTHVFEETAHVPLLMVNPRRFDRLVNPNPGSHVDFAATLADLLGLELPQSLGGRSLLRPSDRQMVLVSSVEDHVKVGVIDGDYKYIYYRRGDRGELYNLREDPGERCDLASAHPAWAAKYRELVFTYVARELGGTRDARTLALETHVQVGYRKLGFDDLLAAHDHFAEALEIDESNMQALAGMAQVLIRQGRPADAVEIARRALHGAANDPAVQLTLAKALLAVGQTDEAVRHSRRALAIDPDHPGARTVLGTALAAVGETTQAIAEFERALGDNPADADAHECLGRLLLSCGDRERGREHLQACLAIDPTRASAGQALESE